MRRSVLALLLSSLPATAHAQEELAKLLPPVLNDVAHFGSYIAVGHGLILASDITGGENKQGLVHIFDLRTGKYRGTLKAKEPFDDDVFGRGITIGEKWVLISSRKSHDNDYDSGAVHVFDPQTWQEVAKITDPDGTNAQVFGRKTAIDGNLALMSASAKDANGSMAGAAYLVSLPGGSVIHKWFGSDTVPSDGFGLRVALGGGRAVVSTGWYQSQTGAAYVFDVSTGKELMRLQGSQTHPGAFFGRPIAIHGNKVLIGAYAEDDQGVDRSGAAYLFDLQTGTELRRFSSDQPTLRAAFAFGLDLNGSKAMIGIPGDLNFFTDLGRVHIYDLETGDLQESFEPADNAPGDLFGFPVVLHECRVVVGSTWDYDLGKAAGSAYLFRLEADLGENYCGPANFNSSGQSAVISASGCAHVAENDLTLEATRLATDRFGYFLGSQTQDFKPFPPGSQGNLCLGGSIARLAAQVGNTGAAGQLTIQVDLTSIPTAPPHSVMAGEIWNFQCWFRDNQGGPTSNFTDGIEIVFH